jgi:hypothetical protein
MRVSHIGLHDDAVAVDDHRRIASSFDRKAQIAVRLLIPPLGISEGAGQHAIDGRLHGLDQDVLVL